MVVLALALLLALLLDLLLDGAPLPNLQDLRQVLIRQILRLRRQPLDFPPVILYLVRDFFTSFFASARWSTFAWITPCRAPLSKWADSFLPNLAPKAFGSM